MFYLLYNNIILLYIKYNICYMYLHNNRGTMWRCEGAYQNDDTTYHESATLSDINITSIVQSETREI